MRKVLCVILIALLILPMIPTSVLAADSVYYVGDDITVSLIESTGALTVSGTGPLPDYERGSLTPWYEMRKSVKSIVIGQGVTRVGSYCFHMFPNVKTVKISDSVTEIGAYAFYKNTSLTSLTLPGELFSIEAAAFSGCTSLSKLSIPPDTKVIREYAFSGCTLLKNIVLPANLELFDATALNDTGYYKTLGQGVNSLCGYSLAYKGTVTATVNIPTSVTVISKNTIMSQSNVKNINILGNVEVIMDSALINLSNLKEITLPDTVEKIGTFALGYFFESYAGAPTPNMGFIIHAKGGGAAQEYANDCFMVFDCLCEEGNVLYYPDCAEGGEGVMGCRYCGKELYRFEVEPGEHSFGEEEITEASCTEDGGIFRKCLACGFTDNIEVIPAAGHSPNYSSPVIAQPTCTERGSISYLCIECGEPCGDTIYLAPTGHRASDEQTILSEPTCTEPGCVATVCSVCGEILEEVAVPPLGHNVSEEWEILIKSSPMNDVQGFRVKRCTECGVAVEYEYFLAGDLNGDNIVTTKDYGILKKILADFAPSNVIADNADVNCDGIINAVDAREMKKLLVS
ncbi:MAG: leucine-rich repeat protein [Clostridia bacterium]|nr:leucine-rich repeat protein [Clostridia bacterium]